MRGDDPGALTALFRIGLDGPASKAVDRRISLKVNDTLGRDSQLSTVQEGDVDSVERTAFLTRLREGRASRAARTHIDGPAAR